MIFVDESSINTGMTRLYGRGKSGERIGEYVPDVRFCRTSIISSISAEGEMVPLIFKGTLTGELFIEYVRRCLVPTLNVGNIVVLDNLSSHKVKGVREAIESAGCKVLYLPAYSPDLNPIELAWSKIKAVLRKIKARTEGVLTEAISEALSLISRSDILGWFLHAGYAIN